MSDFRIFCFGAFGVSLIHTVARQLELGAHPPETMLVRAIVDTITFGSLAVVAFGSRHP